MNNKRTITITATASILTAIAALAFMRFAPQKVEAFNPQPDPPAFGIVGITWGQTLRVNVVNTKGISTSEVPPGPCRVVMTFLDANGNPFTNGNGVIISRDVQLLGGQSTFLLLNADNFVRETNVRLQLRPNVRIQQADIMNGTPPPDPYSCIPSVEVISNATGKTQFMMPFVPAVQRNVIPQ